MRKARFNLLEEFSQAVAAVGSTNASSAKKRRRREKSSSSTALLTISEAAQRAGVRTLAYYKKLGYSRSPSAQAASGATRR
jgi:hypothetical protein